MKLFEELKKIDKLKEIPFKDIIILKKKNYDKFVFLYYILMEYPYLINNILDNIKEEPIFSFENLKYVLDKIKIDNEIKKFDIPYTFFDGDVYIFATKSTFLKNYKKYTKKTIDIEFLPYALEKNNNIKNMFMTKLIFDKKTYYFYKTNNNI